MGAGELSPPRARPLAIGMIAVAMAIPLAAQAPSLPAAASAPLAKELAAAMQAKKITAIASRDTDQPGRYIAALLIPSVQLLLVSAAYERPNDIEYRLYQKEYQAAYADLRSSVLSKDKWFVEDAFCDGLVGIPAKGQIADTETFQNQKHLFDGDFADPKKPNPKKMAFDAYAKQYGEADQRYARQLAMLIEQAKK